MRYLHYTNYQSGGAGLSNGIMSIEVGAVLAHLTNRLLVLDGNRPPPANIVCYDGRVDTLRPSRVTDLLDLPVAWVEPDAVDLQGLDSLDLTTLSLADLVIYFPSTLNVSSADAQSFARDRRHWVTVSGAHEQVPVLRLSEEPLGPNVAGRRDNLCYYSYLFYLDREARRSVYRLLQRMQPKPPFGELARRVARDLGAFNAVHLRRGDFKVTYGVTTLDRKPAEAIEAMDQLFSRKDPLVIVTDERDDPFFDEIKLAYPHHYFVDWHILDQYGADFARLPQTDSLSLACLSQLVAAESKEFIGTMTSTFTGLIQRYRGNRGKAEAFRYLWNELPESHHGIERGRHAISECVPLDRGQMIEQFPGPYSWNRVSPLLNPAWMREWPESFLLPEVIATGALPVTGALPPTGALPAMGGGAAEVVVAPAPAPPPRLHVCFENLQVAVGSRDAALTKRLASLLGAHPDTPARNVIATFEIFPSGTDCRIQRKGSPERTSCPPDQLPALLKQQIGTVFARARHRYAWLAAAAFVKAGRGLLIVGKATDSQETFRRLMGLGGWVLLDGHVCAVRVDDLMLVPLGVGDHAGPAARGERVATPLDSVVVMKRAPAHTKETTLAPCAPAAAVAALISASLDFHLDRNRAVNWLCRIVEQRPATRVQFGGLREAAMKIAKWADARAEVAA